MPANKAKWWSPFSQAVRPKDPSRAWFPPMHSYFCKTRQQSEPPTCSCSTRTRAAPLQTDPVRSTSPVYKQAPTPQATFRHGPTNSSPALPHSTNQQLALTPAPTTIQSHETSGCFYFPHVYVMQQLITVRTLSPAHGELFLSSPLLSASLEPCPYWLLQAATPSWSHR